MLRLWITIVFELAHIFWWPVDIPDDMRNVMKI